MYRTPDWLSDSFYAELCAEIRTAKGWENPSNSRNEQTDLSYACIAICVSALMQVEQMDWANPPKWAADWSVNDMIRLPTQPPRFANSLKSDSDFAQFGKALA